jgi:hypothetical protein
MKKSLFVVFAVCFAIGCNKGSKDDPAASKAAAKAEVTCDAVVEKLASFQPGSGEPEKKLWNKMCAEMPPSARACIVGAKSEAERDACIKDQKLQ